LHFGRFECLSHSSSEMSWPSPRQYVFGQLPRWIINQGPDTRQQPRRCSSSAVDPCAERPPSSRRDLYKPLRVDPGYSVPHGHWRSVTEQRTQPPARPRYPGPAGPPTCRPSLRCSRQKREVRRQARVLPAGRCAFLNPLLTRRGLICSSDGRRRHVDGDAQYTHCYLRSGRHVHALRRGCRVGLKRRLLAGA
jgi:hypothetical protein